MILFKNFINQPYPQLRNKWKIIISISLFIAVFIQIFQPFGLSEYQGSYKILINSGYGFVTFTILIIDLFFVSLFFKNWFNEKSWTVLKQILWLIWILFTIGLGNYLYSSILFSFRGLQSFFIFQLYTLAVGIIPIIILTTIQQNVLLSQNIKSANYFNSGLLNNDILIEKQIISLTGDNQKDKFEIELSDILYVEAMGNYIEIFYVKENILKNTILRSTFKRAELQFDKYPSLMKCHRAFLVNINKIIHVKGNSQGLRLVLKNTETEIPVSRNLIKKLKDKMIFYNQKL